LGWGRSPVKIGRHGAPLGAQWRHDAGKQGRDEKGHPCLE
jgi:hypothetical protein